MYYIVLFLSTKIKLINKANSIKDKLNYKHHIRIRYYAYI